MQAFKNIVSSFTRSPDGKHPPDEILQKHRDDLNSLREQITQVRQQFTTYSDNLIHASESAVVLSKSVSLFYEHVEHSGTIKSVQAFNSANEEIANQSVKVFQQQLQAPEGLIGELDNWLQVINLLQQEIEDAERARAAAQSTSDRLQSLNDQYDRLKKKQSTSGGGNQMATQQEIRDLEERIKETTNVKKSLTKDFQDQKQKVGDAVTNMFKEKYRIFDRAYVLLLECQLIYFGMCSDVTKPFKTSVDYYRKQYPKTYTDTSAHPLHQSTHNLFPHGKMEFEPDENDEMIPNGSNHQKDGQVNHANNKQAQEPASILDNEAPAPTTKERNNSVAKKKNDETTNGTAAKNNVNESNSQARNNRSGTIPNPANSQQQGTASSESKNTQPANAAPQQQNDFLFGEDFAMPKTQNQSAPARPQQNVTNMVDDEFGNLLNGTQTTTTTTTTNGKNNTNKGQHEKQFSMGYLFQQDSIKDEKVSDDHSQNGVTSNNKSTKPQESQNTSSAQTHPSVQRNNSSDFWGMFSNPSSSAPTNTTNAPTSPAKSNNATYQTNVPANTTGGLAADITRYSKSDSQISRPNASTSNPTAGAPRKNESQVQQMEPVDENRSKSVPPNSSDSKESQTSVEQRVQERLRFVKDSYAQEAKEQAERVKYKDELEARLDEWEFANGVRRNLRSLLTKLPEVLWEDSGWKPVGLGDLVQPAKCKKTYQLALRLVHPDRAANRGDDAKKAVICERVFTALNEAWKEYETTT